jgi:para-nitrobenzyl esterase
MIVGTRYGKVAGRTTDGIMFFGGVPYASAQPFKEPGPPVPWDDVREASGFGPTAPQRPSEGELIVTPVIPDTAGEGCLNLNVWTPGGQGLPVLVWIHGGSFLTGASALPLYDGHAFARDGVVLVSVNYRLGAEGFVSFPDAPESRGLLDILAALEWVRGNIGAFGGDPDLVTLAGQSAGGQAVGALLASDRARGLFRQAILQSAPPFAVSVARARKVTALIARRLGVPPTAAAFAVADPGRVLEAQIATFAKSGFFGGPGADIVIGGDLVPCDPKDALRSGTTADVPLLMGTTIEETRLPLVTTGELESVNSLLLRLIMARFRVSGRVARLYRSSRPGASPCDLLDAMATDYGFRIPLNRLAESRAAVAPAAGAPTWMYEFAWRSPVRQLGAAHAMELGFVFDTLDSADAQRLTGPDAPRELASRMHEAWVSYIATGNPGWARWNVSTRPVMVFNAPASAVADDPRSAERRCWDGKR